MPRTSASEVNLQPLVADFINKVVAVVESATVQRVQSAVTSALGSVGLRRGPGRPPKNPFASASVSVSPSSRRRPKQLCPVPGCKNPAAPVFGMVCAQHKGIAKAKIRQYREQRRASKAKKAA